VLNQEHLIYLTILIKKYSLIADYGSTHFGGGVPHHFEQN